jgi:hypothetical protein
MLGRWAVSISPATIRGPRTCAYYSYWSDLPIAGAELYSRPNRSIVAAPTNDNQTVVTIFWPNAALSPMAWGGR